MIIYIFVFLLVDVKTAFVKLGVYITVKTE